MKTEEAEEAREMNGVYSAKLKRLERKFKKLRDQDEESYIEMTFWFKNTKFAKTTQQKIIGPRFITSAGSK